MTDVLLHTIPGTLDIDSRPIPQLVVALCRRRDGSYVVVKKHAEEKRRHQLLLPGGYCMPCGLQRRERLRDLYRVKTGFCVDIGDFLGVFIIDVRIKDTRAKRAIFVYEVAMRPGERPGRSELRVFHETARTILQRPDAAAGTKRIISWYEDHLAQRHVPKISLIKNP